MSEKPISVLLVDDEEELVAHLRKRLAQRGFETIGVDSGEKAIAAARVRRFDVAVVDFRMPGLDGVETLKELKSLQSRLQVIIFTGYDRKSILLKCKEHDAYRFLNKPFEFESLVREIRRAAKERRSALRRAFRFALDRIRNRGLSAPEVEDETERLRAKFEQESN